MRYYILSIFLGILSLSCGNLQAQDSFTTIFGQFMEKVQNSEHYQFSASIHVYHDSSLIQDYAYELKQKNDLYFMRMGDSERIMGEALVITMNREHRSIMVSNRAENELGLMDGLSSLKALDSLVNIGVITTLMDEKDQQVYSIQVNRGGYDTIELHFRNKLLHKVVTSYLIVDAPYTHSVVEFDFDFESAPSSDYFSMDRYAYTSQDGQYVLKSEFQDFELNLNLL